MREIKLTKNKVAIIDDEDFDYISQYKWYYHPQGYATRSKKDSNNVRTSISMHRELANTPKGKLTDHINGDKLDNRKSNLRICVEYGNQQNKSIQSNNSSGYKGVSFHKRSKKWYAHISVFGKNKHLGVFKTAEEAHAAYCTAAKKFYGDFANFG